MQVNVSQLLKEPQGARRHYEFEEETRESHASCTADFLRTDAGILVTASCVTHFRNTCSRCLTSFATEARFAFGDEFFPVVDEFTGSRMAVPEEGDFTIDEHQVLDLDEAIRQYSILALPMKALCRADCQGLCPRCGANLNEGPCSCPQDDLHPAWESLRRAWAARSR